MYARSVLLNVGCYVMLCYVRCSVSVWYLCSVCAGMYAIYVMGVMLCSDMFCMLCCCVLGSIYVMYVYVMFCYVLYVVYVML